MAEYQRFIAYLYEYGQDGMKHSAGHLRVELRQGNCRMTVKVRAKKTEGNCKLYFYIRKPGVFTGFPVGETELIHGEAEFCFEANASDLDGKGNSFEPVCGVLLLGNTTGYLAADWNNQEVTPKEADKVRTALDKSQEQLSKTDSNSKTEVRSNSNSEIETKGQLESSDTETGKLFADNPDSNVKMEELLADNNNSNKKNIKSKEQTIKNDTIISEDASAVNRSFSKESSSNDNSEQQLEHNNNEKQTAEQEALSNASASLEKLEENNSKEAVPDFWSAAKDIVKNLLNAEQEQDPLDQLTTVLHSRRRRVQPENNMMPASATASPADGKPSEEDIQNPQPESNHIKEAVKTMPVLQEKEEDSTQTDPDQRKASSDTYDDPDQSQIQMVHSETENLKDPEAVPAEKSISNTVAKPETTEENVQEKNVSVTLRESTALSQQTAERETAATNAGTAIKGTGMDSLNAAARAYCGNRRLPWQDAPEARELLDNCVKMYPFQDGELAECVRVEPRDIGRLPMEYWNLGNNSFLLHGYCSYKYLLFAKRMNRIRCEYLLMVPGIYQQREKMMARMFGFEQFKCARRREQRPGEFGYWYMTLIF